MTLLDTDGQGESNHVDFFPLLWISNQLIYLNDLFLSDDSKTVSAACRRHSIISIQG